MDLVTRARRFEVWLVTLDPTEGSEIAKTRPCVVISPDEMNRHLRTVIVAPMTSTVKDYPSRVDVTFRRRKGQVALDQIRTVDRSRLTDRMGQIPEQPARRIADTLVRMFDYD
ncbi:MAG: type II toxin-antitoxin system PemK/MazF family toxin [Pseudomonadota bacterium]|nr:type II toxin-antitoxin system PemK/MazF family toxin [Pseudomonadota bacterium]